MAKGPIRHVGKTGAKRPPDLGATPGLVKTTHGDVVPVTAPLVSAVPIVVDPQALRRRVEALEQEALSNHRGRGAIVIAPSFESLPEPRNMDSRSRRGTIRPAGPQARSPSR